jgi:hypothetical protein
MLAPQRAGAPARAARNGPVGPANIRAQRVVIVRGEGLPRWCEGMLQAPQRFAEAHGPAGQHMWAVSVCVDLHGSPCAAARA